MRPGLLTLNAGSSSLKFALFDANSLDRWLDGSVDGFGADPQIKLRTHTALAPSFKPEAKPIGNHEAALALIFALIQSLNEKIDIVAVGHRIVHGGSAWSEPVAVNDAMFESLQKLSALAPLHQPHNLAGVTAGRQAFEHALQVACFDTGFHRTHPFVADAFGLPRALYDEGVRRYGFHGLSYESVLRGLRRETPSLADGRIIIAHLGNGASMCAIKNGRAIGSSMGFSALDGLPMGTRCGQLDPGVILYLLQHKQMSADSIANLLYHESGLRGLSGVSHDMRTLLASDNPNAREAIDYFVYRAQREIGALCAALDGLDTLIFTGGIGENAAPIRAAIVKGMTWLGMALDGPANEKHEPIISAGESQVRVLVRPSDEERVIAEHTKAVLQRAG